MPWRVGGPGAHRAKFRGPPGRAELISVPLSNGRRSGLAISAVGSVRFAVASKVQAAPWPAAPDSKESTSWLPNLRKSDTSLGKIAHGGLGGARGQLAFSAEHSALALASSSSVLQQVSSGPPGAWAAERPAERKRRSGRGSDLRGSFQPFCGKQGFPTHLGLARFLPNKQN